jgi:hypothetical protein
MQAAPRTHSEGYYGTLLPRAVAIARDNAFEYHQQTRQRVCLAPLDNLDLAKAYGNSKALARGHAQFGVVHAEFLPIEAVEGSLGEEQIEIPPAQVIGIRVVRLLDAFDVVESGLAIPRPGLTLRQPRSELY